ncbi:MAG: O-antigen ligase family protein [Acidothermaceae bacterium]
MSTRAVATGETTARPRPWFFDVDAIASCAPLVVLIVIGTWRKGGFFKPDVVALPCLCLALAFVSPVVLSWLRRHPLPVLAGVAVTAWWVVDAQIWRHSVESWRLAAAWLCAAAGYGVARSLPLTARRMAALAVTVIGFALSIAGLVVVAASSTLWTWTDERSLRFQGPLTYPSAIGLYLLITLIASIEVWRLGTATGGRPPAGQALARPGAGEPALWAGLATPVRAFIVLGVVATDSRGALLGLVVLLCFRSVRCELGQAIVAAVIASPALLFGQRDGVRPWLIVVAAVVALAVASVPRHLVRNAIRYLAIPALVVAGWLLATQHHAVSGFDASWTERGHILRGATKVFTAHPIFGAGPDPFIPTTTLNGQPGIDAFAHNEFLELLISIGVVGVVVLAVGGYLAVRPLWARRGALAAPVLATAVAGGLVDFVWHFPALGLLCGAVAGLSAPLITAARERVAFGGD